jgi:hypothetical protein
LSGFDLFAAPMLSGVEHAAAGECRTRRLGPTTSTDDDPARFVLYE